MATITHAREAVIQTLYAQEMGNDKAIEQFDEILKDKKVKGSKAEFAKKLGIAVSDEELDKELAKEANNYHLDLKTYKNFLNESMLTEKRLMIQDNKVLNKLVEASTFIEKEEGEKSE